MTPGALPTAGDVPILRPLTGARPWRARARAALACAVVGACAQPASAADVQFWPTVTVFSRTVDGWRGSGEVQARWTDDLSEYNRTVYRVNGGRLLTRALELFGGYERTQSATPRVLGEHRLWEQAEYTARPGRWALATRARLEQRFVDGASGTASRLRYRFRVQHPLGRTRWLFGVTDEFWIHLNTVERVARRGVDQNRVALTAVRAVSKHLSIEPGYLFIYANAPAPGRNVASHAMTLQVTTRF